MIQTTSVRNGRCEFCTRPARWRSQQVDGDDKPLRRAVLACGRHKLSGRLLAERAVVVA